VGTAAFGQHTWPHLVKPVLHVKSQPLAVHTAVPLTGAVQALPQLPQLRVVLSAVQAPPQQPSPRAHTRPQAPQWLGLVWVLTQVPVGLLVVTQAISPVGQPEHTLLAMQVWPVAQHMLPQVSSFGQQTLFPDSPIQRRP
jgi:hypothetical protein